jgi:hypothetical protein
MGTSLLLKYMKSCWKSEDFGRGKSKVAKARHRRIIKRKANREMLNDYNKI